MVTGQIPFDADSVIGVLLKQISGERPDPVGINPSVPTDLGKTIMRMMSKSQEERFQSFDELIEVLQQHKRDLACGTRKVQIEVPDTPVNRRDRYKILRKEHIVMMRQRKVSSEAARQMLDMLKSDAGIFVEAKEPFAENSIIEIRFTVAGRDDIFRGIGVVRWVDMSGLSQGMGITFLKVSLMPAASSESGRRLTPTAFSTPETPAVQPQRKLSPAETIRKLSQTPLHCRLLRYYYANSGQSVQLQQIASALGVGTRMLADILATYESMGMLQRHTGGLVDFIWPDERGLQREIVAWVSKYGLM
jgi:serine/threonine protein kinase